MNVAKNWALTIMLIALAFAHFSSELLLKEQMIIPVKKTPWKIDSQFMAFSLSSKSHEKNMVGFILFHCIFMGFLFVTVFSWAMKRWILRGFSCFFREILMPYSWHFFVKNPWKFPIKISWKTYEKHVNLSWKISLDFHGF